MSAIYAGEIAYRHARVVDGRIARIYDSCVPGSHEARHLERLHGALVPLDEREVRLGVDDEVAVDGGMARARTGVQYALCDDRTKNRATVVQLHQTRSALIREHRRMGAGRLDLYAARIERPDPVAIGERIWVDGEGVSQVASS